MNLFTLQILLTAGWNNGTNKPSGHQIQRSPLISTYVLREYLDVPNPSVIVLNTERSSAALTHYYMKGHIPTSQFLDLNACVTSTTLIPHNLPESYCFSKLVRKLGINQDSEIVVYDHSQTTLAAARAWWLFRLFGLSKIRILDGGFRKWVKDGYNVTSGPPFNYPLGNFEASLNMNLIRDMEDMKLVVRTGSSQIVDARRETVFSGEYNHSNTLTGGHIPGAMNVPKESLFTKDGTYKSKEELERLFRSAGIDLQKPIISMCHTATNACALTAAASIIGRPDVPVYYGSWLEWAHVETGLIQKLSTHQMGN